MPFEIEVDELGTKRVVLNFGPSHPATHGTLRSIVELDGERIKRLTPEIGYLHSGFEKLAEDLKYNQIVILTDRLNYLSPINNNIGFALACEEFLGIEITPRCQYVRVILAELGRFADHVLSVGLQAMDLGAFSIMLWSFTEREKIYDIFELVTGGRLHTTYTRIGGAARDIPPDFDKRIKNLLKDLGKIVDEIELMLSNNKIFLERTKGVGVITKEDAIKYSLSGPVLRGSGIKHDLRRTRPYLCYDKLDFDVASYEEGDVYARYKVRLFEMRQSLRIIQQAVEAIPPGPINIEDPRICLPPKEAVYTSIEGLIYHFKNIMDGHGIKMPEGEYYSATEVPNGELGFYIISDGKDRPFRFRIRSPSFYNYQIFPRICQEALLPDIVANLSSLNIIAGELDR
jgi:NADH dehydrogenase I D subunit